MQRVLDLDTLTLAAGKHHPDSQFCVMEAVAYVAGETWSDHPHCASPAVAAFCRTWNDTPDPDGAAIRERLKPYIPRLVNSRGTGAQEIQRAWLATDWLVRVHAPAWLVLTPSLAEHASALTRYAQLRDDNSATVIQPALSAALSAADSAALSAARSAARSALAPTVALLQSSAWDLLDCMLAVTEQPS